MVTILFFNTNAAGNTIGNATGYGLKNNLHTPYGQFLDGVPVPIVTDESKERVKTWPQTSTEKQGGFLNSWGLFSQPLVGGDSYNHI